MRPAKHAPVIALLMAAIVVVFLLLPMMCSGPVEVY